METKTRNDGITRRGFFQLGSAALAKAGVIASSDSAKSAFGTAQARDQNKAAFASMPGKVALEEHFALAETIESSTAATYSAEFRKQILEMGSGRIAEMDRGGVSSVSSPSSVLEFNLSRTPRQRSPWRGVRTTIWPRTSQRIPNA
jgi:hypothetical protein